ncbi:hypothetical protein RBH29_01305 [Herbivorax sp. ANBcel31]|uniref:hypothetical protein n=1 Tax=Herbivorax sp. ANBcel31 TaxID=3069754 RepID=UPI0027ADB9DD|nr:hypothetical protein [Herbivorax sp. ANBcel31]MDQ2085075.1 hypothetical protein [Herbivorax sp. ANBcel31]
MKKIYYLTNLEMYRQIKVMILIIMGMLIFQTIAFRLAISKEANQHLRFENLINISGIPVVFFLVLVIVLFSSLFFLYKDFLIDMSMYELLTLTQKRRNIFYSKIISTTLYLFMTWAVQVISIFICYRMYSTQEGIPLVHNALILALARSEFLRFIFPLYAMYFLVTVVLLFTMVIIAYYIAIIERSGKYKMFLILLPWLLICLKYQVFHYYRSGLTIFGVLLSLIVLDIILVNLSLRIFKKGNLKFKIKTKDYV